MSYDLSFEKGQLWLLGGLLAAGAVLLVAGGYLAGRLVSPVAAPVVLPVATIPTLPNTTPATEKPGTEKSAIEATGSPSGSAPSTGSGDGSASASEAAGQSGYTLQFGAFHDAANAKSLAKDLGEKGVKAAVSTLRNSVGEPLAVVRFGTYTTSAQALQAAREQARLLGVEVVIRPVDRL